MVASGAGHSGCAEESLATLVGGAEGTFVFLAGLADVEAEAASSLSSLLLVRRFLGVAICTLLAERKVRGEEANDTERRVDAANAAVGPCCRTLGLLSSSLRCPRSPSPHSESIHQLRSRQNMLQMPARSPCPLSSACFLISLWVHSL